MHIVFFSGDITRSGGTENVSIAIANELASQGGMKISFVSLFEERDEPFFALSPAIRRFTLYPVATHGIQHYFDTCKRLEAVAREQQIDVLIDIDGILDMYSLLVKKRTGVRVISWEHFNYLQNPDVPYRKLTRRWAARQADAIVTLTQTDKELYQSHLKLKCPVIAIANPMTAPSEPVIYDADSHLILSAGRLTYQKGFDLLIDVAAEVLPKYPDWRWLILGEGEERHNLECKIQEKGLQGRVVLEGRVSNMDDFYRKSAMFVMTSRFEGLPMVLLEAKAYRLPLVSFDCPTGPSEIIENGVNGVVVPLGDMKALSKAVERLIKDKRKRIEYSGMSDDNAEHYKIGAIMQSWIRLLHEVAQ